MCEITSFSNYKKCILLMLLAIVVLLTTTTTTTIADGEDDQTMVRSRFKRAGGSGTKRRKDDQSDNEEADLETTTGRGAAIKKAFQQLEYVISGEVKALVLERNIAEISQQNKQIQQKDIDLTHIAILNAAILYIKELQTKLNNWKSERSKVKRFLNDYQKYIKSLELGLQNANIEFRELFPEIQLPEKSAQLEHSGAIQIVNKEKKRKRNEKVLNDVERVREVKYLCDTLRLMLGLETTGAKNKTQYQMKSVEAAFSAIEKLKALMNLIKRERMDYILTVNSYEGRIKIMQIFCDQNGVSYQVPPNNMLNLMRPEVEALITIAHNVEATSFKSISVQNMTVFQNLENIIPCEFKARVMENMDDKLKEVELTQEFTLRTAIMYINELRTKLNNWMSERLKAKQLLVEYKEYIKDLNLKLSPIYVGLLELFHKIPEPKTFFQLDQLKKYKGKQLVKDINAIFNRAMAKKNERELEVTTHQEKIRRQHLYCAILWSMELVVQQKSWPTKKDRTKYKRETAEAAILEIEHLKSLVDMMENERMDYILALNSYEGGIHVMENLYKRNGGTPLEAPKSMLKKLMKKTLEPDVAEEEASKEVKESGPSKGQTPQQLQKQKTIGVSNAEIFHGALTAEPSPFDSLNVRYRQAKRSRSTGHQLSATSYEHKKQKITTPTITIERLDQQMPPLIPALGTFSPIRRDNKQNQNKLEEEISRLKQFLKCENEEAECKEIWNEQNREQSHLAKLYRDQIEERISDLEEVLVANGHEIIECRQPLLCSLDVPDKKGKNPVGQLSLGTLLNLTDLAIRLSLYPKDGETVIQRHGLLMESDLYAELGRDNSFTCFLLFKTGPSFNRSPTPLRSHVEIFTKEGGEGDKGEAAAMLVTLVINIETTMAKARKELDQKVLWHPNLESIFHSLGVSSDLLFYQLILNANIFVDQLLNMFLYFNLYESINKKLHEWQPADPQTNDDEPRYERLMLMRMNAMKFLDETLNEIRDMAATIIENPVEKTAKLLKGQKEICERQHPTMFQMGGR